MSSTLHFKINDDRPPPPSLRFCLFIVAMKMLRENRMTSFCVSVASFE